MSDQPIAAFLRALRRLVRQVSLYPPAHPLTVEAIGVAKEAVPDLVAPGREATITIRKDAFYHGRVALAHLSLEFHGLLREMQARGIESFRIVHPVSTGDLYDLAAFIAGASDDIPVDGTVLLNDALLDDEIDETPLSQLRASYAKSLDALKLATGSMMTHGSFELSTVVEAVEGLFESTVSNTGATLLLSTVKSHDEYTFYHSVNTCLLALAAGRMIGVDREHLIALGTGAVLHDIGKVAVSLETLQFPGRLDTEQWKEIKLHPQEGALAIMAAGGRGHEIAATVAFEHHARFDGEGYPTVTRAGRPHPYSRLVSVADTYDAITTRRSYRRAETPHRALEVLVRGMDTRYDPDLVRVFVSLMGIYPPGSVVMRPDGSLAVVVAPAPEPGAPLPSLVVKDADGNMVDPVRVDVEVGDVVRQVLPKQAGVDPAALLETAAEAEAV